MSDVRQRRRPILPDGMDLIPIPEPVPHSLYTGYAADIIRWLDGLSVRLRTALLGRFRASERRGDSSTLASIAQAYEAEPDPLVPSEDRSEALRAALLFECWVGDLADLADALAPGDLKESLEHCLADFRATYPERTVRRERRAVHRKPNRGIGW